MQPLVWRGAPAVAGAPQQGAAGAPEVGQQLPAQGSQPAGGLAPRASGPHRNPPTTQIAAHVTLVRPCFGNPWLTACQRASHTAPQRRAPGGLWLGPAVPGPGPGQAGQIRRAGAAARTLGHAGRAGRSGSRGPAGGRLPWAARAPSPPLQLRQALPAAAPSVRGLCCPAGGLPGSRPAGHGDRELPAAAQAADAATFLEDRWWNVGYAKLSTDEELAYLGIPGLRVAGGQGVAIIAFCQARTPLAPPGPAKLAPGRTACALPPCMAGPPRRGLALRAPCCASGVLDVGMGAGRQPTSALPVPPCSRCCSCLGPSMPAPAALQRWSRWAFFCPETRTTQVSRCGRESQAAGTSKSCVLRRCLADSESACVPMLCPAVYGLRLAPRCRRLAV